MTGLPKISFAHQALDPGGLFWNNWGIIGSGENAGIIGRTQVT